MNRSFSLSICATVAAVVFAVAQLTTGDTDVEIDHAKLQQSIIENNVIQAAPKAAEAKE